MKKIILVGIIFGLLLILIIAGAYAHGQENNDDHEEDEWEHMEEMHEECEEFHRSNGNRGNIMGWHMM